MTKDSNDPIKPADVQGAHEEASKEAEGGSDQRARGVFSVFDDLPALRKRQDFDALVPTQRVLTRVPVARPSKQTWFRTHPDPEWFLQAYLLEWEEDGTQFFVMPEIAIDLGAELKRVVLRTVVTAQGTASLWPIRMPNADGTDNEWFISARAAAREAENAWIRIVANRQARGYDVFRAQADFGEPVWPAEGFEGLLKTAFAGKIIDSVEHPVVLRLLGR